MKNKFWFLIFMPLLAFCSDIDQEIVVSLAKSEELPSIYISCPSLKLKEILLFDQKGEHFFEPFQFQLNAKLAA